MAKARISKELLKQIAENPEAMKQLAEIGGYKEPKKNIEWVRKTFVIDPAVLDEFVEVKNKRKVKMQDAINEAMLDWIKKGPK